MGGRKRNGRVVVEDLVGEHERHDDDAALACWRGHDRVACFEPVDIEQGEQDDRGRHLGWPAFGQLPGPETLHSSERDELVLKVFSTNVMKLMSGTSWVWVTTAAP